MKDMNQILRENLIREAVANTALSDDEVMSMIVKAWTVEVEEAYREGVLDANADSMSDGTLD